MNYDLAVFDAKANASKAIQNLFKHVGKTTLSDEDTHWMASAFDDLNKAWGALADCLTRQREERGEQIDRLMDELAEAKK